MIALLFVLASVPAVAAFPPMSPDAGKNTIKDKTQSLIVQRCALVARYQNVLRNGDNGIVSRLNTLREQARQLSAKRDAIPESTESLQTHSTSVGQELVYQLDRLEGGFSDASLERIGILKKEYDSIQEQLATAKSLDDQIIAADEEIANYEKYVGEIGSVWDRIDQLDKALEVLGIDMEPAVTCTAFSSDLSCLRGPARSRQYTYCPP